MKKRKGQKYVIKVFEAQWDEHHDSSVKPFFEQLKRQTSEIEVQHGNYIKRKLGHDALYKYTIFQTADGLRDSITEKDMGIGPRKKIGYFACHGKKGAICAINDISRTKLKNFVSDLTSYDGLFFGACGFVDTNTAKYFLNNSPHLKWVAGYESWIPWLEGTINDLLFFKLLLSGGFSRPNINAKWEPILNPQDAAKKLYYHYLTAADLKFSLFYRSRNEIRSTLQECLTVFGKFKDKVSNLPPGYLDF